MTGVFIVLLAEAAASAPLSPADKCHSATGSEIVVCGTRSGESPYRLPRLPDKYERKPIRAETDIVPGVHARAHVESDTRKDGSVAKRVMLTFSTPF